VRGIGIFEPDERADPSDLDFSAGKERFSIDTRGADAEIALHDLIVGDHVVGERRP
jgi:hypothetical protein